MGSGWKKRRRRVPGDAENRRRRGNGEDLPMNKKDTGKLG
jgi:hypothetical protein